MRVRLALLAALAGVAPALVPLAAAAPCALGCAPCTATPCAGGCAGAVDVVHALRSPCSGGGGSFDLRGTAFESTCASGVGGCTVREPPLRFWQLGNFAGANRGCDARTQALANAALDLALPVAPGHWVLDRNDFRGSDVDGCPSPTGAPRVVAEVAFPDPALEGTPAHRGLYLLASAPAAGGRYDFDAVRGGSGCNPGDVAPAPVPGFAASCDQQWPYGSTNAIDADYVNLRMPLDPGVAPVFYDETGRGTGMPLVAGYQVVYATGNEPTTSDACSGGWLPVRNPASPSRALGVIPFGTALVWIAVPGNCTGFFAQFWLALRLVYSDPVNPVGPFDPAASSGPVLVSPVGPHCGPFYADTFESPALNLAKSSVPSGFTLRPGDPVPYAIDVAIVAMSPEGAWLEDTFDACLDLSGFDPVANPWQVVAEPPLGLNVQWSAPSRTLAFDFVASPWITHRVWLRGIRAGAADDPACCNAVRGYVWRRPCLQTAPETCFPSDSTAACAGTPERVTDLRAVRFLGWQGPGTGVVYLTWAPAADVATAGYNVWKVSGDKRVIPVVSAQRSAVDPLVAPACTFVPRDQSSCQSPFNPGWLTPGVEFFQVLGVCANGAEGPV